VRIGYLIDLHVGGRNPPVPTPALAYATMEALIEEGIIAEEAGFHSLQIPERHGLTQCFFPGPVQLLSILAHETRRVALGTFSCVLTLHNPMQLAEELAVVDNLSQGRLYSTVSRGFRPSYWDQFGIPQEKLLGRFKEALEIWELAFQGERFDFAGEHFHVRQGLLTPQPYQDGGWPIWGGGHRTPAAIRRSAAYGAAWTCDQYPLDPPVWHERRTLYNDYAAELGKRPFVVLMRDAWVEDTMEDALAVFGEHLAGDLRWVFDQGLLEHPEFMSIADITPEAVARHAIVGDPDTCMEELVRYHEEFGVDYFALRLRLATGPSLADVREQIRKFGELVVRPLHARYAAPDHPALPAACRV